MKKILLLAFLGAAFTAESQCDTTYLQQGKTVAFDEIMSGVYYVDGTFKINEGVTVYVNPYTSNGCGTLEIHAKKIVIEGTINGDYAGYSGGIGGYSGSTVNSLTGDQNALTSCSNKDNSGIVSVEGGKSGTDGIGNGGGIKGADGTSGSGPKQVCGSSNDAFGMIAGAGGAGGGGGASYGGNGTAGKKGGNGSAAYSNSGAPISTAYPVVSGLGGNGGNSGTSYGTEFGNDISLGSGGAGAGGGGRSYSTGTNGQNGGNGGGLVILHAENNLTISGTITVNGENGKNGGDAGNGGATSKCCSDLCDDCGEATFSSGAGAGAGSGAGSGGGIFLKSDNTAVVTGTLSAAGGIGGIPGNAGAGTSCSYSATFCGSQSISTGTGAAGENGGDGGGGRIKLFVESCSSTTESATVLVNGGGMAEQGTFAKVCNSNLSVNETETLKFSVYPNPATDIVSVTFVNSPEGQNGNVQIQDALGRIVSEQLFISGQPISFDISHLNAGLYFINIEVNNQTSSLKFIKK